MCSGSWQGAGRMCTLPLPGVFLLGPQGSAGAAGGRRDGCHGCCRCLGRSHWRREGRRGFGSHRAGTGELDDQRGERGWFAPSSARCSWRCHSAACGRPPLGHRAVARLGVWLLQAARCPWKSLACSCATGMEEKRRGAGGALQAVCATPCVTGGDRLALLWHGACRTAGPRARPGHGCEQCREQPLISGRREAALEPAPRSRFGRGRNSWAGRCNCRSAMLFILLQNIPSNPGRSVHAGLGREGAALLPAGCFPWDSVRLVLGRDGRDVGLEACLLRGSGGHCAPSLPGQGQPEWLLTPFPLPAPVLRLVPLEVQWKL